MDMVTPKQLFKSGIVMISTVMIGGISATATISAKASADETSIENTDESISIQIIDPTEFNKLALIDDQTDFNFELAQYLYSQGVNPEDATGLVSVREKRGKTTMAAKVAGKAMKAFLKKMGKNWWDKQSKKWYFPIKVNWKTINAIANYAAGFNGTIENAITNFLTSHHLANKNIAKKIAWLIVTIVF
ncbi:hypothetical protein [uncultured Secundilactobacillus sp.]|uniref:hypothetical protein n=1 Tax=uncultured Secundilactobacillus sp. TaxID=2813935 RepID=UPI00258D5F79|nr:hypothetical protein [uncultured Secundilactobacillus sp.]